MNFSIMTGWIAVGAAIMCFFSKGNTRKACKRILLASLAATIIAVGMGY
jgi:hypothetical protein